MKLTPAMKIILAVAAICIAITLITTNNIATVMVLQGINTTPVAGTQNVSGGNQGGGSSDQGGYVDNGSGSSDAGTGDAGNAGTGDAGNAGTGDAGNAGTGDAGNAGTGDAGNAGTGNTGDTGTGNAGNTGNAGGNAGAQTGSKMTTQQIVDVYKKGVNNAHTKAKTAVRVKDGAINYKKVVVAGKLSSIAESLMGMFMVADENSIEVKNEEWDKTKVPPATCNLTAAGVKSATCVEKNGKYIVTIVAKDQTNPKAGADGVGSVIDVIEETQITGAIGSVPGLELNNISIAYENVTVVATIDIKTGNMENLKINAPCYLSLDAKVPLLGSIDDAKVGIQVISEFAMTY